MQPHSARKTEAVRAVATEWFLRLREEPPSPEVVIEWQQWLAQDEAHRREFSELEDLWDTLGRAEGDLRVRPDKRARRWPLQLAAAVVVLAVAISFVWWRADGLTSLPPSAAVETHVAENRSYVLADGSRLDVGARSRVVVDFGPTARNVFIDSGEAFFDVVHDKTRPFIVRAGNGSVTAVGTAFAVRHLQGRVTVTVVEGTVNVNEPVPLDASQLHSDDAARPQQPPPATIVRAGEGVVYGRMREPVQRVDAAVAIAWRTGHLMYIREPLEFVVPDVERYTNLRILIAERSVAEMLYTGTVFQGEIDEWLAILADAFPIDVVRVDDRTVLLKPRSDSIPAEPAQ